MHRSKLILALFAFAALDWPAGFTQPLPLMALSHHLLNLLFYLLRDGTRHELPRLGWVTCLTDGFAALTGETERSVSSNLSPGCPFYGEIK